MIIKVYDALTGIQLSALIQAKIPTASAARNKVQVSYIDIIDIESVKT